MATAAFPGDEDGISFPGDPSVNTFPTIQLGGDLTGGGTALATTATKSFVAIPTCAGAPTGVPALSTGFAALVYDTTNHKLWAYDPVAAAWKGAVLA